MFSEPLLLEMRTEFTVMFEEAWPDVEEAGFRTMWAEPCRDQDRLGLSFAQVDTLIAGLPIVRELDKLVPTAEVDSRPDEVLHPINSNQDLVSCDRHRTPPLGVLLQSAAFRRKPSLCNI